jgi:cytochrome c oxidase cbb3-type subunit III
VTGRGGIPSLSAVAALVLIASSAAGCGRETRNLHPAPAASDVNATLADAQENAYAMNEGKRLYDAFNCTGCHAHGGGAIGPALMDTSWIYGSKPDEVFATIVAGRPNGMPAFRARLVDAQIAQLVAYVRSMSGLTSRKWAPGRNDSLQIGPAENTRDRQPPRGPEVLRP